MKYVILLSALSISLVSAYFSIIGLTTMFPAVFWAIVIMGGVLEVGKLVSASWLHHNWKIAPRSLKIYLTTAVVVLIFITSMGIFGFLSKSHIKHQKDAQEVAILAAQLGCKIYYGPYVKNFQDVYNFLDEKNISKKISSTIELSINLLNDLKNNVKDFERSQRLIDSISSTIFKETKKKINEFVNYEN